MKASAKERSARVWHLWGLLLLIVSTCFVNVFAERNLQSTLSFVTELFRAVKPDALP